MRPRLASVLIVVGAFGAGLTAGALRDAPATRASMAPPSHVAALQQQIAALQQRLQTQDATLAALRQQAETRAIPEDATRVSANPGPSAAELQASLPSSSAGTREDTAAPAAAGQSQAPATEEEALSRFYHYLEDLEGRTPRQRRARMQALIDDLRALGEPAVSALIQVLETGENSPERRLAASLLGALQNARALPVLQDVLEREEDLVIRRAAAQALRRLQLPEALPVLAQTLANTREDRLVRLSAAYGLAQLGEAQGTAGLMQIFHDAEQDGQGRAPAFRALMGLNDPVALPFMRQLAVSDADVSYRLAAMRFLARQGDQEALPLLQQVLDSPREQPSVVDTAIQTREAILSGQRPAPPRQSPGQADLLDTSPESARTPRR